MGQIIHIPALWTRPADPRDPGVAPPKFAPISDQDMRRLEACEAVVSLADQVGGYRVLMNIVKTMAKIYEREEV